MRMPSTLTAILVGLAVLTAASSASAMYHPTEGRWMARDPAGYMYGGHLLEYGGSSPYQKPDAYGLSPMVGTQDWGASPNLLLYLPPQSRPAGLPPEPWDSGVPPGFTPAPVGPPPPPPPPPPPLSAAPDWLRAFKELGCCDCEKNAVEEVMWKFANAAADMNDKAFDKPLTIGEAIDFTKEGVVATAAGQRTGLFTAMPECARKVVDEMEKSKILTTSAFIGWAYNLGATGSATGSWSVGNAWLATEAKRSELAARGIGCRLKQCEEMKKQHPEWRSCCKAYQFTH